MLNSLSGDSDFFLPHVVKGVQRRAFRTNLSKAVRTTLISSILTTVGSNFTIHFETNLHGSTNNSYGIY